MKSAILILAHKNVWQLEKLVERLSTDFDIYIHADKKWDIDLNTFKKYENVYFTKRYSVNWGSYTQILSTLTLFKTAFSNQYQYYMLISGQDLPLKSNAEIKKFLATNNFSNYAIGEKLPLPAWMGQNGGFDRLNYYFGNDFNKSLIGKLKSKSMYIIQNLQKKFNLKRKRFPIDYYGGPNWINLNNEMLEFIMKFLNENKAFLNTFKYTYCADEIWLQTIVFNSGYPIENNNLRYLEWEETSPSPKTFAVNDLQSLKASNDLFARKFDENIDKEVINAIYEMTK